MGMMASEHWCDAQEAQMLGGGHVAAEEVWPLLQSREHWFPPTLLCDLGKVPTPL